MAGTLAAQRYAKALMQLAVENDQVETVAKDMRLINNTLDDSRELRNILKSPVVRNEQKLACLKAIFVDTNEITLHLFEVLIANKRLGLLEKVVLAFLRVMDELHKVVTAKVTTAVPLEEKEEKEVMAKIKAITNSEKVNLAKTVDKELLGGFLLRIGDLQYDASIAGKLNSLQHQFKQSTFA